MSLKKTVAIATAAGALAAISVPAMALENEFHGMYRAYGYMTNALSGGAAFNLAEKSKVDRFIEQRARVQYIAKASDDLKLVTHFELDTKFGGSQASKYANAGANGSDAGTLDADKVTLETKNVYLDFNCPLSGANVKVGVQPFNDAYQGTFGNFDGAGALISKKLDNITATYGYFAVYGDSTTFPSYKYDTHFNVLDVKLAMNKDVSVGVNYYNLIGGAGATTATAGSAPGASNNLFLNMLGLNTAAKVGPAALNASFGYQFGDSATVGSKLAAYGGALAAKVDAGAGKVNASVLYLSGNKTDTTKNEGWQPIGSGATYFTPANMWLVTRNAATINSSTAIGGSSDITRGGRGIFGIFAGYEGAMDKIFYNANVGYAQVAQKQAADSAAIGTELNVTVGYKLYANLSASVTGAYAILGDGYGKDTGTLLSGGVAKADNPFLTNIALNYTF